MSSEATLESAFWEYERALMANDLEALDRLFAPGPETLRGDAAGILVGHGAISDFRRGRGGAPKRTVEHVEFRMLAPELALAVAITAPETGGRGQQTQVWRLVDGQWRVTAAHVALPAPAINPTVWRLVGTPLLRGAAAGVLSGPAGPVKGLYDVGGRGDQRLGVHVQFVVVGQRHHLDGGGAGDGRSAAAQQRAQLVGTSG